jgi:gamma-glutamylcyclotransferase (GGCT)/AIG2-like uncharacterized protein YtfP
MDPLPHHHHSATKAEAQQKQPQPQPQGRREPSPSLLLPHLAFVYGTLKQGFGNHWLMEELMESRHARFLGAGLTSRKFPLVCGPFRVPFLLHTPSPCGHHVRGEVYEIDDFALARLDDLEGITKGHYERKQIDVTMTTTMMMMGNGNDDDDDAAAADGSGGYGDFSLGFDDVVTLDDSGCCVVVDDDEEQDDGGDGDSKLGYGDGESKLGYGDGDSKLGYGDGDSKLGYGDGDSKLGYGDGDSKLGYGDGDSKLGYGDGDSKLGYGVAAALGLDCRADDSKDAADDPKDADDSQDSSLDAIAKGLDDDDDDDGDAFAIGEQRRRDLATLKHVPRSLDDANAIAKISKTSSKTSQTTTTRSVQVSAHAYFACQSYGHKMASCAPYIECYTVEEASAYVRRKDRPANRTFLEHVYAWMEEASLFHSSASQTTKH